MCNSEVLNSKPADELEYPISIEEIHSYSAAPSGITVAGVTFHPLYMGYSPVRGRFEAYVLAAEWRSCDLAPGWPYDGTLQIHVFANPRGQTEGLKHELLSTALPRLRRWLSDARTDDVAWTSVDHRIMFRYCYPARELVLQEW